MSVVTNTVVVQSAKVVCQVFPVAALDAASTGVVAIVRSTLQWIAVLVAALLMHTAKTISIVFPDALFDRADRRVISDAPGHCQAALVAKSFVVHVTKTLRVGPLIAPINSAGVGMVAVGGGEIAVPLPPRVVHSAPAPR